MISEAPALSPLHKFWDRGVDIMVNAASALLVAFIVGLFWFLRKEFELWYDHRKAAEERTAVLRNKLLALTLTALYVETSASISDAEEFTDWRGIAKTVSEIESLMLEIEMHVSPVGRAFYSNWFDSRRIYKALRPRNVQALEDWHQFVSDLAKVAPTSFYPAFPLMKILKRLKRREQELKKQHWSETPRL